MPELMVTVTQQNTSPTSEGLARHHRVLIDRPTDKGGLDGGPSGVPLAVRRAERKARP